MQEQNLRAVIWPLLHPDGGIMYCDRFSWREMEKEQGIYDFDGILKAVRRAKSIKRFALLRIQPDVPAGVREPLEGFLRLINALGEQFSGERAIWGVDVLCPGEETEAACSAIADAFCCAFPHAVQFIHAGSAFEGMIKGCGVIVTDENVGKYVDAWRHTPLRMGVDVQNPEAVQGAIDNQIAILEASDVRASNAASHAGHRFQVKTVALKPGEGEGTEAAITFANVGGLPCYTKARFCLRLNGSDVPDARVFPLPLEAADVGPGMETTVTQTLDTKGLSPGEYDVHVGLFCEGTEYPISFGIEGRISDGYYEGRLILCV